MDPREAITSIRKFVTGDMASGLLVPEQAKQFYVQVFDQLEFSKLHRKETKRAKSGEVDKIGLGQRLLREKVEATDNDYRVAPTFDKIEYTCKRVKLPWEMSEETIHDNIEGEGLETKFMGMLTTQTGIDLEDLHWNSDTATDHMHADYDFLKLNDGWLKQLETGAQVVDAAGAGFTGTKIEKGKFFAAKRAIPSKYFSTGRMVWLMNESTKDAWVEYVSSRATGAGDLALLGSAALTPLGYPIVKVPSFADGVVVFGDPMNFIAVNTWDIRVRKTTEGKSAVMNDMRYGSIFFDDDPVIEELEAAAIITNMTIE